MPTPADFEVKLGQIIGGLKAAEIVLSTYIKVIDGSIVLPAMDRDAMYAVLKPWLVSKVAALNSVVSSM
jgi:hypothetical protein